MRVKRREGGGEPWHGGEGGNTVRLPCFTLLCDLDDEAAARIVLVLARCVAPGVLRPPGTFELAATLWCPSDTTVQ